MSFQLLRLRNFEIVSYCTRGCPRATCCAQHILWAVNMPPLLLMSVLVETKRNGVLLLLWSFCGNFPSCKSDPSWCSNKVNFGFVPKTLNNSSEQWANIRICLNFQNFQVQFWVVFKTVCAFVNCCQIFLRQTMALCVVHWKTFKTKWGSALKMS